ncbi:P-loop containing nucleoside triphosphate hydrolase protein [Ramicandelaber brevisporus]|nr:P-loop containing nucleoside triphosphate hydrolase protein [Ramicandelaber brevisporus]
MYTLLSGLYRHLTRREEFSVVIVGLDNSGKTTLLERIKTLFGSKERSLRPEQIVPTVGLNLGRIELGRSRVRFWDLGGQRELRELWDQYYPQCHAVVFVVDAADPDRLDEVKEADDNIGSSNRGSLGDIPVLMVANKMDRSDALPLENIKEVFNTVFVSMGARDSRVLPTSAINGDGVRAAVEWLFSRMDLNRMHHPPTITNV